MVDPRIWGVGYARLYGKDVDYVIRKHAIVLGRASKSGSTDVVLGDNMNISRAHAKITFNFVNKSFELTVLGKNGATVGSTQLTPSSPPYALKSQETLSIGEKVFHFFLPKVLTAITEEDLTWMNESAPKRQRQNPPELEGEAAAAVVKEEELPGLGFAHMDPLSGQNGLSDMGALQDADFPLDNLDSAR
mmetsp:Transcript_12400/g.21930  ORF Transcript_12400/g.21930 Transcript_12400/m.21930 type:complete len:190 (-) Transcript_12400:654-1223(-)